MIILMVLLALDVERWLVSSRPAWKFGFFFLAVLQGFIEMEDIQASMAVLKYYTQVAPCIR